VDELWQRFRTFWTPVLWGIGVFLAGLIVVHILTPDPEAGVRTNESIARSIKGRTAPAPAQIRGARENAELLGSHVVPWAARLDQRRGDGKDPELKDVVKTAAADALAAAFLRGNDPKAFEGDATAAAEAKARYDRTLEDALGLLQTQDPNVGYSRLQAEVVGELAVRANRADVDVGADEFGLSSITSIDRADLPRRLSNLALVARVVDLAIRARVRSIDAIGFPTLGEGLAGDPFLALWPVEATLTGTPSALREVLDALVASERPTALGSTTWAAAGKKSDLVTCSMTLYSVRVRPSVSLRLESEE
jgi:hypothetical protein